MRILHPNTGRPATMLAVLVAVAISGCAALHPDASPGAAARNDAPTPAQVAAAVASATNAANTAHSGSKNAPALTAAAAAAAMVAAQGQSRSFADVTRDATETAGLFNVYRREDRTWLEIAPEQFDQPFFFAVNLSSGIGEKWFFAGMMGDSYIASFHRLGNQVQLIAHNTDYFASPNTPEARAVADSFSNSLLSAATIASQPHPEKKSVLIDVNALLMTDIGGAASMLERTYHQSYAFDARNSSISKARVREDLVAFNLNAHFAVQRLSTASGASAPGTLPDSRSMFLGFYYNFSRLPEVPMQARAADDRVGYFTESRWDYGNDQRLTPRVDSIRRWRLEKSDPDAALSAPRQPIVFWLDRNIPERYRRAVTEGVLEWNKAFEKIGFKDALQVKVQPEDADFDTIDSRHASIRWITTAHPLFGAFGPTQVDPRTGEILDADIAIDPARLRNQRFRLIESRPAIGATIGRLKRPQMFCMQAEYAAQELGFAMDVLEARGDLDPSGPAAEAFVLADLRETVAHEVGHALGLRHNFRASTVYSQAELNDPGFTRTHGISGSVMEYNAINLALAGERQGAYVMESLGPYDYWAIEYGYREIPAAQERDELARIAGRSDEPLLAYATDEDATSGVDPAVNQLDLGNDPLEFARRRLTLARELWNRWQSRELPSGSSYTILRRNIGRGLAEMQRATLAATRYVGGVTALRDHAGSSRAPLTPVDASRQRAALKLIESGLFQADSFRFKPEFMRRLQVDYLDASDDYDAGLAARGIDYSLSSQVLLLQRGVLGALMSDAVAQRILDSDVKLDDPKGAFRLSEVYDSLHGAIWSELKTGREILSLRRNLQREHILRISGALLRSSAGTPADARALLRDDAKSLVVELRTAQKRRSLSKETRAHLAECLGTLEEALKAPIVRQAA